MRKAPKAHKLPDSTQEAIGRAREKNPKLTLAKLAAMHHCTVNQVRGAIRKFNAGDFAGRRGRPKRTVAPITSKGNADKAFNEMLDALVLEISETKLTVDERLQKLGTLASIRSTAQRTKLTGQLKKLDADFLMRVVRRFMKDATDDEILAILRDEEARWKASL